MKPTGGFTLIELMIVIIIILVVGGIFLTHFGLGASMYWWLLV